VIDAEGPGRVALVVHPTRAVDGAVATLDRWAGEHGVEVVELCVEGGERRGLAAPGEHAAGDLVVALGGDGTMLSALRAAAADSAPVLGEACTRPALYALIRLDGSSTAGHAMWDPCRERRTPLD
jgi:hypothetical protein